MSSTDYTYDDQGQFFPFFVLTITGLVTLPLSYSLLKPTKELESTAPRIRSDYRAPQDDLIQSRKRQQRRRERKLKRMIASAFGWLLMAYMVYLIIVTQRTIPKIWDPYDILDIRRSASEKEISRHYKRLSLKYHPDKIRPDASKNETMEMLNDRFVELTKAYKALTDEEVRNNYLQYGHPDGKQSFSIGIALPQFIVTEGNGKYVLLFYGVLLGVLLPYTVGKWWYGTQALTKEKVLVNSANKLFKEFKEDMNEASLVGAVSDGDEHKAVLKDSNGEDGLGKVEKAVLSSENLHLSPEARSVLKSIEDPVRRKALALLWAYLGRIELGDAVLDSEKYEVAAIALKLTNAFTSITLAFGLLGPLLSSYRTSQSLIQAIPPGSSPLLQLPYLTPQLAASIERKLTSLTIQKFMNLSDSTRRQLCAGLSRHQYETAITVASQLPYVSITKQFFKVVGEKAVTPSSLVQFVVKARVIPPGSISVPEPNASELLDVDPEEGDVNAILGRNKGEGKPGASPGSKAAVPPLAHAPYFARDHSPRWHVFLADSKAARIAVPPFSFTAFEKAVFNDDGTPTFNVQTWKCQFQAPPQVGKFIFTYHVVCDSYVGLDSSGETILDVVDPKDVEREEEEEDEISEPDEDSIAGQMAALKAGGIAGVAAGTSTTKRRKKKPVEDDSSDEDSDTEGDVSDTSETDTETDED